MIKRPTLETDRLLLRPFTLADASVVQRLAGDRAIASTTLLIPHPYKDGMAEKWIRSHRKAFEKGKISWAITLRSDNTLIGAIGLNVNRDHLRAEVGYWIGKPYWNRGYCTEAARAVVRYGFDVLGLNRIEAHHFARNPASGRVLQKLGMKPEGCLRQSVKKWDRFEDVQLYAVLKSDRRHR